MNEFSLEHGNIGKGIVAAVLAGLAYLIVPLILVIGLSSMLLRLEGYDVAAQIGLQEISFYIFLLGVPIVILSFFRGFYPRGSRSRFVFGAAAVAVVCLWIWMVTRQGNLALEFDQFGLGLSITGFVLLFIGAAALRAVYFYAEMVSYRQEWLSNKGPRPVIGSKIVP